MDISNSPEFELEMKELYKSEYEKVYPKERKKHVLKMAKDDATHDAQIGFDNKKKPSSNNDASMVRKFFGLK